MTTKFFRTKITVKVLSEGGYAVPGDNLSLEQLAYDISEGDCVGRIATEGSDPLSPVEMANALSDFGSEPGFFQLDDGGKSL